MASLDLILLEQHAPQGISQALIQIETGRLFMSIADGDDEDRM